MAVISACLVAAALSLAAAADLPPSCEKPIFCDSRLLHDVQLARLFPDSKTFVDLELKADQDVILADYDRLLNETNDQPSRDQLQTFLDQHFQSATVLQDWLPPDYQEEPRFLRGIRDPALREFGKNINSIWPMLGRQITDEVVENPDRYSIVPVPNGFIVPGGRFNEIYYWDTYWIIEGLLISGMRDTARGMIENLISLLKKFGHIPNGSRWYYQERSQPPLLTAMVSLYMRETKDLSFLRKNIKALEQELNYWLDSQIVTFDKGGRSFTMLRYFAPSAGPRPESYAEDYESAAAFSSEERKTDFYIDMKSAAESGWDFSSRWFVGAHGENTGNLSSIHTRYIVPVDLNAMFANALKNLAYFQAILHNPRRAAHWASLARQWQDNIERVLWDDAAGCWFDYDLADGQFREYFYPSNLAPLWMGAVDKRRVRQRAGRVLAYLRASDGLDFPGGVPASLVKNGEQWDFPNAWPPLVSIVVNALEALGTQAARDWAFAVAQTWVRACHAGYRANKQMFEKYDAEVPGQVGGGGEYVVQEGFGWSNGVVMEFLAKYGRRLTASDDANAADAGNAADAAKSEDTANSADAAKSEDTANSADAAKSEDTANSADAANAA